MTRHTHYSSEHGVATVEFAVTAAFFLMMLLAVFAGGYLFWLHNALVEATRRGARYAASQCKPDLIDCPNSGTSLERIKNVALYGNAAATGNKLVYDLTPENVTVEYSVNTAPVDQPPTDFGVGRGTVSVKIQSYNFKFILSPVDVSMPPYQTTVAGESAGYIPEVSCPD